MFPFAARVFPLLSRDRLKRAMFRNASIFLPESFENGSISAMYRFIPPRSFNFCMISFPEQQEGSPTFLLSEPKGYRPSAAEGTSNPAFILNEGDLLHHQFAKRAVHPFSFALSERDTGHKIAGRSSNPFFI